MFTFLFGPLSHCTRYFTDACSFSNRRCNRIVPDFRDFRNFSRFSYFRDFRNFRNFRDFRNFLRESDPSSSRSLTQSGRFKSSLVVSSVLDSSESLFTTPSRMMSSLGTVHDAMIRLRADRVSASTRGSRNNDGVKVLGFNDLLLTICTVID